MSILDDTLKYHHRVEQRANQLAMDMVEALEGAQTSILGKLARLQDRILKKPFLEDAAVRRKALLEAQKGEIERILSEVYSEIGDSIKDAAQDVFAATTTATAKHLATATGLGFSFTKLDRRIVNGWFEMSTVDGLLINDWLAKLKSTATDRIVAAGRQAMVEGLGVQSTARLMRQKGIQGSVPGLEGLARTWLQSAAHYSKEKVIMDQASDLVEGWRYVATLDQRTCLICGPDDGRVFKLGEAKPVLPRHWLCRCTYVPVTKTFRDLGMDVDELSGGERPAVKWEGRTVQHRDGSTSTKFTVSEATQVPSNLTYDSWLRGQLQTDPDFVRGVLGKTRFDLFAAGKLQLKSMSAHGRIKRLSEL
ncbi:phage minor head protein [Desulfonatronum thioautotrophicum]|uniref:phage minor head protein n=1 Tax=Desulfonatronum thioautotrophicum TaxID=617001 RepID=UPI0005EB1D98|nr:phage minor head protein [Desulfonatronum thioautotrophicum]